MYFDKLFQRRIRVLTLDNSLPHSSVVEDPGLDLECSPTICSQVKTGGNNWIQSDWKIGTCSVFTAFDNQTEDRVIESLVLTKVDIRIDII